MTRPQRFKDLGIDLFLGDGRFTGPNTFEVDGTHHHLQQGADLHRLAPGCDLRFPAWPMSAT